MPRLLFIEDGDIAFSQGLERTIHPATRFAGNPVMAPDRSWEEEIIMGGTVRLEPGRGYRMWYQSYQKRTYLNLYAESADGIHWQKPMLGQYEDVDGSRENNIFLSRLALRSPNRRPVAVNQDHNPNVLYTPHLGAERRYTLLSYDYGRSGYAAYDGYFLAFSADGIHWTDGPQEPVIPGHADVGWFTFDKADGIFRAIVKNFLNIRGQRRRSVFWTESRDGYNWTLPLLAVYPDLADESWAQPQLQQHTQFYGMPIFRYESVLLGFLQDFRVSNIADNQDGEIDVQLTCSRDGRHWTRAGDRRPILPVGEKGAWDSGMVLTGNSLVVDGDEVRIYYSGEDRTHTQNGHTRIGMATWPRDRFVGLKAGSQTGQLHTTNHLAGRRLHVNGIATGGEVVAEVVAADGQVIAAHGAASCQPLRQDALDHTFRWESGEDLSGQQVSVHLHLTNAEIFSVWWD